MPDLNDSFARFAVALGIGLLIGLERGWKAREEAAGSRTAGLRTFALIGLLGAVVAALSRSFGEVGGAVVVGLSLAAFTVIFGLLCREENRADGVFSATTAVAGMVTFALGAYALVGDLHVAAATAVGTTVLLALREAIHALVAKILWREMRAGLVLLAMTFIALPLLSSGPVLAGIDVRRVWVIAIVLALASFVGYVLVKLFGASTGTLLAGAVGGLVSSTAVMAANAARAREGAPAAMLAAGAALATTVSLLRTAVLVGALNLSLLQLVVAPLVGAGAVAALLALAMASRADQDPAPETAAFRNPFDILSVIGFAVFLGLVLAAARFISDRLGAVATVAAAAVAGMADVDAISVSLAQLSPATIALSVAAMGVLAAAAGNTVAKTVIGAVAGRGRFATLVMLSHLLPLAAGAAILAAQALWPGGG